jgi:hypothetical protein
MATLIQIQEEPVVGILGARAVPEKQFSILTERRLRRGEA